MDGNCGDDRAYLWMSGTTRPKNWRTFVEYLGIYWKYLRNIFTIWKSFTCRWWICTLFYNLSRDSKLIPRAFFARLPYVSTVLVRYYLLEGDTAAPSGLYARLCHAFLVLFFPHHKPTSTTIYNLHGTYKEDDVASCCPVVIFCVTNCRSACVPCSVPRKAQHELNTVWLGAICQSMPVTDVGSSCQYSTVTIRLISSTVMNYHFSWKQFKSILWRVCNDIEVV